MSPEDNAAQATTTPDSGTAPAAAPVPETILTALSDAKPAPPPAPEAPKLDGDSQTPEDAKPTAPEIPEKYEFTLPEGMTLNAEVLEKFDPIARELGLDQADAQKVVDLYAGIKQAEAQASQDAWAKQVTEWRHAIEKDPVIGGINLPENIKAAQSAIARFAPEGLKAQLESSGFGNNPDLVRMCVAIGKAMGEDTFIKGNPPGVQRSAEEILYGGTPNA